LNVPFELQARVFAKVLLAEDLLRGFVQKIVNFFIVKLNVLNANSYLAVRLVNTFLLDHLEEVFDRTRDQTVFW
jgi:hypothetical protein